MSWYCAQGPGCPCCDANRQRFADLAELQKEINRDRFDSPKAWEGARVERARIVKWLRADAAKWAEGPQFKDGAESYAVSEAADAIERGDHLK